MFIKSLSKSTIYLVREYLKYINRFAYKIEKARPVLFYQNQSLLIKPIL